MEANSKPRWFRRTWVIATLAGLIGIGIGAASMTQDVTQTPEYKAVALERDEADETTQEREQELSELQAELSQTEVKVAAAEKKVAEVEGTIPAREQAVTKKESQLKEREAAIKALEKGVRQREKAVGIVEREIEANTIAGDGIYQVGADIKAGRYKTDGGSDCYYAILNSTDTSDIADNNNTSGPAFVSVRKGQYLELSGCAEWVLQR